MTRTIRAGLIGAGQICEFHVRALRRVPNVEIVGVTDVDPARARAVADRFGIRATYSTLKGLVEAGVDVVHVLTPPTSHAAITLEALGLGCHVLVEKPLATSKEDSQRIVEAARQAERTVGVDHSLLFDPFVKRAMTLLRRGEIGDVVAVDYFRCQRAPDYRGGVLPPQYDEPGYPFRDMGVHALYLLEAFLGPIRDVTGQFAASDGDQSYSEWRALVRAERGSGQIHLSWNVKPAQSLLLIQGTRGIVRVDLHGMTVTTRRVLPLPEMLQRVINAAGEGAQTLAQLPVSVLRVASGRIVRHHGLHDLVATYYENLRAGKPAPVTAEQAVPIVDWMERVAREADEAKRRYLAQLPRRLTAPVLLTGATGFIGRRLLQRLFANGERVRVLVRQPTRELMRDERVEVVAGDLADPKAVDRAVAGTSLVYHVGAATRGSAGDFERGTVRGTHNIVESVVRHGVTKLVYISSLSVLHTAAIGKDHTVTEAWPLEPCPHKRGVYTETKLEAERIVLRAVRERGVPAVILRPGQVVGPGAALLTAGVAQRLKGRLLILGNGRTPLPTVHVDDLIDAIVQASRGEVFDGSIFHVVDGEIVTQNDLAREYVGTSQERLTISHVPRWCVALGVLGVQTLSTLLRRPAPVSRYRIRSASTPGVFDCTAARERLGWRPRVGVRRALPIATNGARAPVSPGARLRRPETT